MNCPLPAPLVAGSGFRLVLHSQAHSVEFSASGCGLSAVPEAILARDCSLAATTRRLALLPTAGAPCPQEGKSECGPRPVPTKVPNPSSGAVARKTKKLLLRYRRR